MWARRCGAPAKVPSILKILFMSGISGSIGLAVYNYMASGDVSYLDITRPTRGSVICLTEWPLRSESGSGFFEEQSWRSWYDRKFDWEEFLLDQSCVVPSEVGVDCTDVRIPVRDMSRDLGVPMGSLDAVGVSHDYFDISAHIFWWLSILLWFTITVHDLALLHSQHRNYVMDWSALNKGFPRLRHAFALTGFFFVRFLFCRCSPRLRKLGCVLGVLLTVPIALWALFVCLTVIGPMFFVLFLCNPIRLSRFWTFGLCLLLAVYCLFLAVSQIVFLSRPETMPRYAVTWHAHGTSDVPCTCGCTYPMSSQTCTNLFLIGAAACTKSLLVAFRGLKGMRRSQWANLMTVTFAVPVTVYEVDWQTPECMPIEHRDTNTPVQGELAFDPFALMDEQPNSAFTTVSLQPEELARLQQAKKWNPFGFGRMHEGPKPVPGLGSKYIVHETEQIGCCGFPCLTGGMQGQLRAEELTDEEELGPLNVDAVPELAPKPSPAAPKPSPAALALPPLWSPATVASCQVPPSPMSVASSRMVPQNSDKADKRKDVKFACVSRTRAHTDAGHPIRTAPSPGGPSPATFGTQYSDSSDRTTTPNPVSGTHFSFADAVREGRPGQRPTPKPLDSTPEKDEAPMCFDLLGDGLNPTVEPSSDQAEIGQATPGGLAASLMSPGSCASGVTLAPRDPAEVPGIAADAGTMDWDVSTPSAALEGEGLGPDGALASGVQRRGRAATTT